MCGRVPDSEDFFPHPHDPHVIDLDARIHDAASQPEMRKGIQHKLSTGGMEAVMRTAKSLGIPGSGSTTVIISGEGGI